MTALLPAVHETWMRRALELARAGAEAGEVPVGAVIVRDGVLLGEAFNQPIAAHDPSAHAEVLALRQAGAAASNYRLPGAVAYVTLEPCLMCVGALIQARVASVVYGADEPKWGALRSLLDVGSLRVNHRFEVVPGVLAEESRGLVVDFFRRRRR